MRNITSDSMVWLTSLFLVSGCTPNALQVPDSGKQQVSEEKNLRNRILRKLEGKETEQKQTILLEIISNPNDKPLRRDAIRYLNGILQEVNSLSKPLTELFLLETDSAVVSDLKALLSNKEFDVDGYLLNATTTATETQHLRIIEILGLRKASTPGAILYFKEHLRRKNAQLFIQACEAVVDVGAPARVLLPELIAAAAQPRIAMAPNNAKAARDSRDKIYAAVRAIDAVGPDEDAVATLITLLSMEAVIAASAADALAQLEGKATAAIPALKKLLERDDHGGRDLKSKIAKESAEKALAKIQATAFP